MTWDELPLPHLPDSPTNAFSDDREPDALPLALTLTVIEVEWMRSAPALPQCRDQARRLPPP